MKADRVYTNAKVYSIAIDGTETRAEAVAIKDGKFAFVGSNAEVQDYIGEDTKVTDCEGGSVLPGFGDAHMHFAMAIRRFGGADLSDLITDGNTQTPDDIVKIMQDRLKAFADSHPDDPLIHGSGWDRNWFHGALSGQTRQLSRHDIDAVVSDRPVVLDSACGHLALLNTKALELAGLTKDMPDPDKGLIRREPDGTPDGYIQEPALIVEVCSRIPGFEYTEEQYRQAFLACQAFFNSRGFTYLSDCLRQDLPYEIIRQMAEDQVLTVRIDGVYNIKDASRNSDLEKAIAERGAFDVDDLFKVDTVKFFIDEDFAMMEPWEDAYCDETGHPRGFGTTEGLLWDLDHFKESMEKVKKAGYHIHVHSYGDRASKETIDAMINAQKYDPEHKLRDIIAHIFFIRQEDIPRMADAGIIGSIQPQWESFNETDNALLLKMMGSKRFKGLYPNGSLARGGVRLANGSDFTVTVTNALEGITVAMTRKFPKNSKYYETFKDTPAVNPSEKTTLKDALMGWTINVAAQFGREGITGSIEVGKSAELVVLDGDIENTPPEDICLLKIKETVFKGESVYSC